jgi:hypothetical protein
VNKIGLPEIIGYGVGAVVGANLVGLLWLVIKYKVERYHRRRELEGMGE